MAAIEFRPWLRGMQAALSGAGDSDVACGTCTACCRSAQFVHIAPDETDTLAHVPRELLFPAPRMPRGHVLLGYDDQGRCPMLGDQGCSIYAHRPRACRVYDCRIFAATGVDPDDKPLVAERVRQWRFDTATAPDEYAAVRAAADYLDRHPGAVPQPLRPAERAVLAVELHDLFLGGAQPAEDVVRRRAQALRRGDAEDRPTAGKHPRNQESGGAKVR